MYGGDIYCDFESELWYKGLCNWVYSQATKDFFAWKVNEETKNHFIEITDAKTAVLESLATFNCYTNDRTFTIKYSIRSAKVRFISNCTAHIC